MKRLVLDALAVVLVTGAAMAQGTLWSWSGTALGDAFGDSVAMVGDVDGDGHDDVLVGARFDDVVGIGTSCGSAWLYSGRTGELLTSHFGAAAGDLLGDWVAGVGDVDADGRPDYAVAVPGSDVGGTNRGSIYVYSGRDRTLLFAIHGSSTRTIGGAVDAAGDVDADGYDDVLLTGLTSTSRGVAVVVSGRTQLELHAIVGPAGQTYFASAVAGVGDVDGDGFADFAVGAWDDATQGTAAGAVHVYSGRTGTPLYSFFGDSANDHFGQELDGAGDVDADGVGDLIVGAHLDDNTGTDRGSARVFSLRLGTVLYTFDGDSDRTYFGLGVAGAGDVDGDRHDDLVVSSPSQAAGGTTGGMARVFSGRTGLEIHTFHGLTAHAEFGRSIAGGGDLDADGFADVVVGAPNPSNGTGDAYAFTLGFTGTPATARAYGAPCAGSDGRMPRIGWVGRTFLGAPVSWNLRGAPTEAAVLLNLGNSDDTPLAPYGMPDCTLLATVDGFNLATTSSDLGFANTSPVLVPNDPAIIGFGLAAQWVCLDPGANPVGIIASDSERMVFGN